MKTWVGVMFNVVAVAFCLALFFGGWPFLTQARNIAQYSDTITDSKPLYQSNHTFQFKITKAIPGGGYIDVQFPPDFTVATDTERFSERNVELEVNGVKRTATTSATAVVDGVSITRGAGGTIRYTLASGSGIAANATLQLTIGNRTSLSQGELSTYSTSTGTTTIPADMAPITNSSSIGTHTIDVSVNGASEPMYATFSIAMVQGVGVGPADTTEEIPPFRFNGAPTSSISGTTLSVELSLETDEFAICKWSTASGTAYSAMPNTFDSTGLIVHTTVVAVAPGNFYTYYVRCIDDEGNFNIDDYLIQFSVNDAPTGESNTEGDVNGDGTGSGNQGSGDGSGSGGSTGNSNGGSNTTGGSSGGGGSGGGSGGSSGGGSPDNSGGGFESADGQYPSGDANVIINGYAFPGSSIYVLVDGQQAKTGRAGTDGKYSVTVTEIARGAYTFGVYAVDTAGVKSSTFSTSFTVTGGKTSSLSNINVMPSIKVTPDPVDVGATAKISGYSIPNATVSIENQKDGSAASKKTFTATSNSSGYWTIDVPTTGFSAGTYKVRAKAESTSLGIETGFSGYTFYGVGQAATGKLNADLNTDGKVNLTDFSILLFWWGGAGGNSNPPADINGDGSVSLTDFSIMLFQWTG